MLYTIIESGSKVHPAKQLPQEYLYSRETQSYSKSNRNLFSAKLKIVPGIGEMVEIASNRRWEKTKHMHNKNAKYGVYRYDTRVAFERNGSAEAYTAELVILNADDGKKYLYDIVNIKKDDITAKRLMVKARSGGETAQQTNAVTDSVLQTAESVNSERQNALRDDQTQTEEFKRWFGDSVVVNEDGSPKVVYHQTAADFTAFNTDNPVAGASDSETPNGIKTKLIEKGDVFYDVTKIKDITEPMRAKYSEELQYPGQSDVTHSVLQTAESVNSERQNVRATSVKIPFFAMSYQV